MLHFYSLESISLRVSLPWQQISHIGTYRLGVGASGWLLWHSRNACSIQNGSLFPLEVNSPELWFILVCPQQSTRLTQSLDVLVGIPALQVWCCLWSTARKELGNVCYKFLGFFDILTSEVQHPTVETQTFCSVVTELRLVFCMSLEIVYIFTWSLL